MNTGKRKETRQERTGLQIWEVEDWSKLRRCKVNLYTSECFKSEGQAEIYGRGGQMLNNWISGVAACRPTG